MAAFDADRVARGAPDAGGLVGDADIQTWHRAQAAEGTDDTLADDLVTLAHRARSRQSFAASSAAWEHAAALTTDRVRAGQALAAATDDALASGDIPRTRALAERVLRSGTDGRPRGEVVSTLGVLEQYAGSVPAAADRLREAVPLVDGPVRVWVLTELAMTGTASTTTPASMSAPTTSG